jgi:hypothetical protein
VEAVVEEMDQQVLEELLQAVAVVAVELVE